MIHRAAALRAIKGKSREEQTEYLLQIGLDAEQAADFIDDYALRSEILQKIKVDTGSFSESERFKQMVEGFKQRIFNANSVQIQDP